MAGFSLYGYACMMCLELARGASPKKSKLDKNEKICWKMLLSDKTIVLFISFVPEEAASFDNDPILSKVHIFWTMDRRKKRKKKKKRDWNFAEIFAIHLSVLYYSGCEKNQVKNTYFKLQTQRGLF